MMRAPTTLPLLALLLASPLEAADLAEIRQRGTLRVLTISAPDSTATPAARRSRFFHMAGGVAGGLEGEILAGFASLHGVRLELVHVEAFERLLPTLAQGGGDLVAGGITDTPTRRKLVDFTSETFPTRNVVVTRKPHRVVRTLDELRQERIGAARGTSYVEAALAAGVPRENIDDSYGRGGLSARDALREGRVTAVIDGMELVLTSNATDPADQLGMFVGPPQSLALAVRKEDTRLRRALDEYLVNLRRTPTWNRLVVKYFGERTLYVLKQVRQR